MRKTIVPIAAAAAALALAATATASVAETGASTSAVSTATVSIVPVAPGAIETANVTMTANPAGAGFSAAGTGTGFNPISQYVSLAYGVNSVPVTTGTIPPCADDGTLGDPNTSTLRMFVGAWLPVVGGNRSMVGTQPLTNIEQTNTMSLRRANVPLLPQPGDIRPQTFQIRSCGLIVPTS